MSDNRMFHLKCAIEAMLGIAAEICHSPEELEEFGAWVRKQLNGYGSTEEERKDAK